MWLLLLKQIYISEWRGEKPTHYIRMFEKTPLEQGLFQITDIMSSVSMPKIKYKPKKSMKNSQEALIQYNTVQKQKKEKESEK